MHRVPNTHSRQTSAARALAALALGAYGVATGVTSAGAQAVESFVVTIDSSTIQPVATGLFGLDADDHVIVLAEGAVRTSDDVNRFDHGWFGPSGQTRLQVAGQPVPSGMPFGALMGGFSSDETQFEHLGRMGSFNVGAVDVGDQFHIALNMSDAGLASLQGSVTVTLVYVPSGSADAAEIVLDAASPDQVPTGIISAAGDKYIILPYGAVQPNPGSLNPYTHGRFGSCGRPQVTRPGQPIGDGPYGALFGVYSGGAAFHVGDGGCYAGQPADVGQELELLLNMSAADRATLDGQIYANVIRVPALPLTGLGDPSSAAGRNGVTVAPNPIVGAGTISFSMPASGAARLRVADASGRWVRTLVDATLPAGTHAFTWDGSGDHGASLPAGVYFYQLSTSEGSRSGRVILSQ